MIPFSEELSKGVNNADISTEKEWYEKIKSGEKTIEYREVKPYWTQRLLKMHAIVN